MGPSFFSCFPPPPPEIPPPVLFSFTCFFLLNGQLHHFFPMPVIEGGRWWGVSSPTEKNQTNTFFFTQTHKTKCKKKQNKKNFSFFANRLYLLSWKLFLIYCVRVVRDSQPNKHGCLSSSPP